METRSDASLRKELDELRELFKQAQDQAQIAQDLAQRQSELDKATINDLELAFCVAPLPSLTSPVPNTNLMSAITGAVPIDEHRLNDALSAISREIDGRLQILTNDANAREDRMLQNIVALENRLMQSIAALIGSNVGNFLPVAPVSTGPQISFNLAACQSNAKASQCQVEPELSQSVLKRSRDPAQPILPNVATVSTGPQISFSLAACQSNAKASQCQVEPELSQSVLNIPAESTSPSSSQRGNRHPLKHRE